MLSRRILSLCALGTGTLGAVLRGVVVDRVQRLVGSDLHAGSVEHSLTIDFDRCQATYAADDKLRVLLNLSSGHVVPVWLSCRGVFYDVELVPQAWIPQHHALNEHASCEGALENVLLDPVVSDDPATNALLNPGAKTQDEYVGSMVPAILDAAHQIWGNESGTAASTTTTPPIVEGEIMIAPPGFGRRRLLQQLPETLEPYPTTPPPTSLPVCTGKCEERWRGYQFPSVREIAQVMLDAYVQNEPSLSLNAWTRVYNFTWECLAPPLCTTTGTTGGYVASALHRERLLGLERAQAVLRKLATFRAEVEPLYPYNFDVIDDAVDYATERMVSENMPNPGGAVSDRISGVANKVVTELLNIFGKDKGIEVDFTEVDLTGQNWAKYLSNDRIRRLVGVSPVDRRQACAAVRAEYWAAYRQQTPNLPAHLRRLRRAVFDPLDKSAPTPSLADKAGPSFLQDVSSSQQMYEWLQKYGLAPAPRDVKNATITARLTLDVNTRGYPTQAQWDPPCRAPASGQAYDAIEEARACQPEGPLLSMRTWVSDTRCKFRPGNMEADYPDETTQCYPIGLKDEWRSSYESAACLALDEQELYCGLRGVNRKEIARACTGDAEAADELRERLVRSLLVLQDENGHGATDLAWESVEQVYSTRFCGADATDYRAHNLLFRSVGDPGAPGLVAGECPCAESSNEGLKACAVNPWERLDPRNESGKVRHGLLRAAGMLQGCTRYKGASFCVPVLEYGSLQAAFRDAPAALEDKCDSAFYRSASMNPSVHEMMTRFLRAQITALEAANFDCTEARAKCRLGSGTGDGGDNGQSWLAVVLACVNVDQLASTGTVEFAAGTTCELKDTPGSAPMLLPPVNMLLLSKSTYSVNGRAADQQTFLCKPNYVSSAGSEGLRLTLQRASADVQQSALALEAFVSEIMGKTTGDSTLMQLAEQQRVQVETALRGLNLSESIDSWLEETRTNALNAMNTRIENLRTDILELQGKYDMQLVNVKNTFKQLNSEMQVLRGVIGDLATDATGQKQFFDALVFALQASAAALEQMLQDFAVVIGKSAASASTVQGLARNLLYGRQRYAEHVKDLQEQLALDGLEPFLPKTPGGEHGVVPRALALEQATALVHESRLWQALLATGSNESSAAGQLWVYQLRLHMFCDLRWLQHGVQEATFSAQNFMQFWGPAGCLLGSLDPTRRCSGCRLHATARRCRVRESAWAQQGLDPLAWLDVRFFRNLTWLRSGAPHEDPAGHADTPCEAVLGDEAVPAGDERAAWARLRHLAPNATAWWPLWARPAVAQPGLDLDSAHSVAGLLVALCQSPQDLWGARGPNNASGWLGRSAYPILTSRIGEDDATVQGYWDLDGVLASANLTTPTADPVQGLRAALVCGTTAAPTTAFATATAQLAENTEWAPQGLGRQALSGVTEHPAAAETWQRQLHSAMGLLLQYWPLAVRSLVASPLLQEFALAEEGQLPALGLWTEFSQRMPTAIMTGTENKQERSQWDLLNEASSPLNPNANAGASILQANAEASTEASLEATTDALESEFSKGGSGVPADQETLDTLRSRSSSRDATNCYHSSWLAHNRQSLRLYEAVPLSAEPRVELSLELDETAQELADWTGAERDALRSELREAQDSLQLTVLRIDTPGLLLLREPWYWLGEPACALATGCASPPLPGGAAQHLYDVSPSDVCLGAPYEQRSAAAAGGACVDTVRLLDPFWNGQSGGNLSALPAPLPGGVWSMFSFEDFHLQHYGTMRRAIPGRRDFDPRQATASPLGLVRNVRAVRATGADGTGAGERHFCVLGPGAPVGYLCQLLDEFQILNWTAPREPDEANASGLPGRLRLRAASGRGLITAQLRVPEPGTRPATPQVRDTSACPLEVRLRFAGTRFLVLEYDLRPRPGDASLNASGPGANNWTTEFDVHWELRPADNYSACQGPAGERAWTVRVGAVNATPALGGTPGLTRFHQPSPGLLCDPWRARLALPPAGPAGDPGQTCFLWESFGAQASVAGVGAEESLLGTVIMEEESRMLAALANVSIGALTVHDEWVQHWDDAFLAAATWLNRGVDGGWLVCDDSKGCTKPGGNYSTGIVSTAGPPAAPAGPNGSVFSLVLEADQNSSTYPTVDDMLAALSGLSDKLRGNDVATGEGGEAASPEISTADLEQQLQQLRARGRQYEQDIAELTTFVLRQSLNINASRALLNVLAQNQDPQAVFCLVDTLYNNDTVPNAAAMAMWDEYLQKRLGNKTAQSPEEVLALLDAFPRASLPEDGGMTKEEKITLWLGVCLGVLCGLGPGLTAILLALGSQLQCHRGKDYERLWSRARSRRRASRTEREQQVQDTTAQLP